MLRDNGDVLFLIIIGMRQDEGREGSFGLRGLVGKGGVR